MKILNFMLKLLNKKGIRYLIVGGMTTLVSLSIYYVLYNLFQIDVNISNIISVILAILFAYITNKLIVFRSYSFAGNILRKELITFVASRLVSMVIEVAGVFILFNIVGLGEMPAKISISFFIVAINYLFSHYFVFNK